MLTFVGGARSILTERANGFKKTANVQLNFVGCAGFESTRKKIVEVEALTLSVSNADFRGYTAFILLQTRTTHHLFKRIYQRMRQ